MVEALLSGPRGRRALLEYALASERLTGQGERGDSLTSAVFFASHHLDPGKGRAAFLLDTGAENAELALVTSEEVASRLDRLTLAVVTPRLLVTCLSHSVDLAAYWQEPDGQDVLAATVPMQDALRRVAEHLAGSMHAAWWCTSIAESSQWTVQWDSQPGTIPMDPQAVLRAAREKETDGEQRAVRERPADPTLSWSGSWWSTPSRELASSTRELFDTSPAGLWFVEDSLGWEGAVVARMAVPAGLRIYEIDSAEAWAGLCRQFPLEQTAQKRHDWYRTTGRAGRWVVPDWARVAEFYDGVHLQVAAYLSAAGTAISVDGDTATVIAGWGPDETFWFTPRVGLLDDPVAWVLEEGDAGYIWRRTI